MRCLLSLPGSITQTQLVAFTHHMWICGFIIRWGWMPTRLLSHSSREHYDPAKACETTCSIAFSGSRCPDQPPQLRCVIFLASTVFGRLHPQRHIACSGPSQDMFSDSAIQLQPVFAQVDSGGLHLPPLPATQRLTRSRVVQRGVQTEPLLLWVARWPRSDSPCGNGRLMSTHPTPSRSNVTVLIFG